MANQGPANLIRPSAIPPEFLAWARADGTVFFDSSLASGSSASILAVRPLRLLRGGITGSLAEIERAIEEGRSKYPRGGLAGFVTYEGEYLFGCYPEFFRWDNAGSCWVGGDPPPCDEVAPHDPAGFRLSLRAATDRGKFCADVLRIQELIAAGDIYQACLTYPLLGGFSGDPLALYLALRGHSPAPYAAYLHFGNKYLLSASPELFLGLRGREVETRPIKGTRARGAAPAGGEPVERELLGSQKERAELTMITDLERNDLGQICEFGSVGVPELFRVEAFAQVVHMVSTVRGTLRGDCSHPQALAACFPGGSITGAPKIRAMQILREIEGQPRGAYTGAIGYFGFGGRSAFSIAIRTLEIDGARARYGTGAGIVADSEPEAEWEETLAKARTITGLCDPLA